MTWTYFIYSYVFLPLVAFSYVAFGCWVAYRLVRTRKSLYGRLAIGIAVLLMFSLIPSADVIVGRFQFSRLCDTGASVKIFRTVTLDEKYFTRDGFPKTELTTQRTGYEIADRYVMEFSEEQVLAWPRIVKHRTEIRDKEKREVLGERVDFFYWGGWLVHQMPGHLGAETCSALRENRLLLEKMVFQFP